MNAQAPKGKAPNPYLTGGAMAGELGLGIVTSALNVHESRQNRRFQRNMSNTAHQREMADLRKAGLNPILTGKYGGSSTPSGNAVKIDNPAKNSSAYAQLKQQQSLVGSQISQTSAQTDKIKAETQTIDESRPLILQEIKNRGLNLSTSSAKNLADTRRTKSQINQLELQLEKLRTTSKMWTAAGELTPKAKTIRDSLSKLKLKAQGWSENLKKNFKNNIKNRNKR